MTASRHNQPPAARVFTSMQEVKDRGPEPVLDLSPHALLERVTRLHIMVDSDTARFREVFGETHDVTLRAEAAGAALHRLKWSLERLSASEPQP